MNYFVKVFDTDGEEMARLEVDKTLVKLNSKTREEAAYVCLLETPDAASVLRSIREERE